MGPKARYPVCEGGSGYSFQTWGLVRTTAESEGGIGIDTQEAIQTEFTEGQAV